MTLALESRLVGERLNAVHDAWRKTAAGRMAPRRGEITPALLKSALPWVWMIEVVDGGRDFRFRIAGDRVVQFMGRPYTGLLLSAFLDQPFFQEMREHLLACVKQKRPLATGPARSKLTGKEHVELEVLALPLSEDGETVTALFGAVDIRPIGGGQKLPKGQP